MSTADIKDNQSHVEAKYSSANMSETETM